MKLPKKVILSGKTYTVEKDPKTTHSSGQTFPQEIVIGTKGCKDERIFEHFMHEVVELIACEKCYRYGDSSAESIFVMNHDQFYNFVIDIAAAILPMIKK